MMRFSGYVIFSVLCLSFPLRAQNVNSETIAVNWSDPARPGLLRANIRNGSVSIKAYEGKDVIIETRAMSPRSGSVTAQGLRRLDPDSIGLNIEEQNNVMFITTRNTTLDADITVKVPTKTNLVLWTQKGAITVEGVAGEVEASSNTGPVTLSDISGSAVAHSVDGAVKASFREVAAGKPMSFISLNKAVDVTLPGDTKANLKLMTDNGSVYTDFDTKLNREPVAVQDSRQQGRGRYQFQVRNIFSALLNGGGPEFDLRSLGGDIYIHKRR